MNALTVEKSGIGWYDRKGESDTYIRRSVNGRTFLMVKPDGVERNPVKSLGRFSKGFQLVGAKLMTISQNLLSNTMANIERPFRQLVDFITS